MSQWRKILVFSFYLTIYNVLIVDNISWILPLPRNVLGAERNFWRRRLQRRVVIFIAVIIVVFVSKRLNMKYDSSISEKYVQFLGFHLNFVLNDLSSRSQSVSNLASQLNWVYLILTRAKTLYSWAPRWNMFFKIKISEFGIKIMFTLFRTQEIAHSLEHTIWKHLCFSSFFSMPYRMEINAFIFYDN